MKRFENKVIVVTGASSGIGEALAYEFARLGAKVVIAARSSDKLAEVAERIARTTTLSACGCPHSCRRAVLGAFSSPVRFARKGYAPSTGGESPARVLAVTCDVSREEDCRELVGEAVAAFGGIDILICNAGISMRAILDEVDMKVLRRLMDVNFWGTAYTVKYALPWLQASRGVIVGVSSVGGLHGLPGRTGYSASKYAMTGFLETVRIENIRKGVHVMIACPGFTATNVRFTALTRDGSPQGKTPREEGKMMSPEEVARRIVKGIRRRKRLLLMEWEGRGTHFIKKFAPGLLDRMLYKVLAREPDSPLK